MPAKSISFSKRKKGSLMKRVRIGLTVFLILAVRVVVAGTCGDAFDFDFDDNIFVTDAKIYLWDPTTKKEVAFSTADWALVKHKWGKPGKFKGKDLGTLQMRKVGVDGVTIDQDALREFTDSWDKDAFKHQIERALKENPNGWKGPSWDAFVIAMKDERTRQMTTLISARMHSPEAVRRGLEVLHERKLIDGVPETEHLFAVGWPGLDERYKAPTPAESKSKVMLSLLDKLNAQPVPDDIPVVQDADGINKKKIRQWGFSDDDYDNYAKAVAALSPEVGKGRWPNVKVVLYFTGLNNPDQRPRIEVVNSKGQLRTAAGKESWGIDVKGLEARRQKILKGQ